LHAVDRYYADQLIALFYQQLGPVLKQARIIDQEIGAELITFYDV